MPLILPGNVAAATAGGFEVANSCRFNAADSSKLTKTPASAGNQKRWTYSFWIKRCNPTVEDYVLYATDGGGTNKTHVTFVAGGGEFRIYNTVSGSTSNNLKTNRLFRDPSAWYHIVVVWDTANGTTADRIQLWVNGVRETSFSASTLNDENSTINDDVEHTISGTPTYIDGYMAEVCFIDGTVYTASDFGEFDEDSPSIWKPKDVSGLTFGTNGFYLDFEDSSNLGIDANGGTDLTEANLAATDSSIDTPTNNFPTINVLNNMASAQMVITEGNLHKHNQPNSNYHRSVYGTMGASSGKWYYEMKITNINSGDTGNTFIGIIDADQMDNHLTASAHYKFVNQSRGYGYFGQSGNKFNNGSDSSFGDTWRAADDIVGCAFDLDNLKIYFSKDGTWQNSGDPESCATGTGSAYDLASGYTYLPAIGVHYGDDQFDLNFGSPINTISSGNADANDYGNFEYAVPSGYYALCTKNLAEFG